MACSPEIPEKATLRVRFELAQDSTDGEKYWKPLVNLPYFVDTHSNEEDHKIALDLGGHEMRNDLRHCWSPSSNSSCLTALITVFKVSGRQQASFPASVSL